jgi:hypothetical protein
VAFVWFLAMPCDRYKHARKYWGNNDPTAPFPDQPQNRVSLYPASNTAKHPLGCFFLVRPARAHSWRCKSSRELATANEVKRNCGRATDRGEEAWIINREPMNKNRIRGTVKQGERARSREALVAKARWCKSGGCAVKECVLTRGDLALRLKGRRGNTEREVSRGHSSCHDGAKGRTRRSVKRLVDE